MIVRQQCKVEGCTRLGELREVLRGVPRYRTVCPQHRRPQLINRRNIPNNKCEKCGKLGKSDRHRLGDPSRAYTRENVIVLCKACHAEAHNHSWMEIKV